MPELLPRTADGGLRRSSHLLEDVSFDLEKAEASRLLGRNGVGKTTLLLTLMGLDAA